MICLIAASFLEAQRFAYTQYLSNDEWFFCLDENDLVNRKNFHVLVVGNMHNVPSFHFEKLYQLAKQKGNLK